MFLKFDEIAGYIPNDNKYHDVQIINDNIYIDGNLKNSNHLDGAFENVCWFSGVFTDSEVIKLYEAVKKVA